MFKKTTLLVATSLTMVSTGAFAQANNNMAAATLRGNGASSIANVLVQELNCFGGTNNDLGLNTGATTNLPEHVYAPAKVTAANPNFDCNTKSIQPAIEGQYVSTGSGSGKANWRNKNAASTGTNPFGSWTNIQFAFSDSPLSSSDLSTYNTTAAPTTGAAIQVPLYLLPVAVAYAPAYGKIRTGTGVVNLSFNVKKPRADGTGGLKLKKSTYCGIFNGTITNWNDAAIKADNSNLSLMSPNDNLTRWNTVGVPIKLVGRVENSGTTNIFTRHLTAVCGTSGNNYTAGGTDQLPAALVGTAVYDKATGVLSSGAETLGKYGRSDGSDGVAKAVGLASADPVNVGDVTLNGRVGYIGADWVAPSVLSASTLHSADLQSGTTTKFLAPTATNATVSFKGILPPQSDAKGKFLASATSLGLRNDPTAWVLPANATTGLANPAAGYPIVGTTNVLLYTCYATAATRNAVQAFVSYHIGKVTIDNTLAKVPAKLVANTAKDGAGLPTGILPRNGIAPLSAQWLNAINETFLTKTTSGTNPASLNLWIQDKLQKKSTDVTASNPSCTAGQGA